VSLTVAHMQLDSIAILLTPLMTLKRPEKEESDGFLTEKPKGCRRVPLTSFEEGEVKTRPMAWEVMADNEVPTAIDWRNYEGNNYCSWTVN